MGSKKLANCNGEWNMKTDELIKEFKTLEDDEERWSWVKDHQTDGVIVNCDNDSTFITIGDEYADFEEYVGWTDGIFKLFKAININATSV